MFPKKVIETNRLSGLSIDYKLAFASLSNLLERIAEDDSSRTKLLALKAFRHRRIKNYVEYFTDLGYENPTTNANTRQISLIKENVDLLNELRTIERIDVNQLQEIHSSLLAILKGFE